MLKALAVISLTLLFSCTMAPWYKRPEATVTLEKANEEQKKIAKLSWQEYFKSPDLQRVIQLALDHNKNLEIANLNIEASQANYGITRSSLLPAINVTGTETRQGVPAGFSSFTPKHQFRANVNFTAFELDFFGRLRSLNKTALESFLATEQARNLTRLSLITETANAYLQLLCDTEVMLTQEGRRDMQAIKTEMVEIRYAEGFDSRTTLLASEALFETAKITYELAKKTVEQDKNALMLLTGTFDYSSLPKHSLDQVVINETVLLDTPSELLLSRPDVQQAEHELLSANANIGAARAAFFPSITLTGTYGYASRDLNSLLDSKSWTFSPQINLPIFAGGKNWSNLKLSNAQKQIKIANYQKAIQTAFKETKNELANRKTVERQLDSAFQIFRAKSEAEHIALLKHKEGIIGATELANVSIDLFSANQTWANARKEYLVNLVNLYKVLGGGSEALEEEKKK